MRHARQFAVATRIAAVAALALTASVFVAPGVARAQEGWRYLPLREGNSWTWHRQHPTIRFRETVGTVDRRLAPGSGIFHLDSQAAPMFTAAEGLWVGFGGNVLYGWNVEARRWVRIVDFGAAVGARWTANLGADGVRDLAFTLRSKTARVQSSALGRAVSDCVVLDVRRDGAATTETWTFAPNIGLIKFVVPTGGFDLIGEVSAGIVWGRKLGPIAFSELASGPRSFSPTQQDNTVRLFNSQASLDTFWREHAPGTAAPTVDFATKSVVVALAGGRFGPREVQVERVSWNFPNASARVSVVERDTPNAASAATTWPFTIVVLEEKVRGVSVAWRLER